MSKDNHTESSWTEQSYYRDDRWSRSFSASPVTNQFMVGLPELHYQWYFVEAESKEQAERLVKEGKGKFTDSNFHADLSGEKILVEKLDKKEIAEHDIKRMNVEEK